MKRRDSLRACFSYLWICLLLCAFLCARSSFVHGQTPPRASAGALTYLDSDAPILVGISPSQLPHLYAFALRAAPQEAPAIRLAVFAMTAILGFNPSRAKAWSARGFSLDSPMLFQIAAPPAEGNNAGQSLRMWRTRMIFKPSDKKRAILALQSVKLRTRAAIERDSRSTKLEKLARVLQVHEREAKRLLPSLKSAGIFLIGQPTPLAGILIASTQGDFIVLDLLVPSGRAIDWNQAEHRKQLLSAVMRRPRKLEYNMPGASSLRPGRIGLWVRPVHAAKLLRAGNLGKSRAIACAEVASLASQSSFNGVSAEMTLRYGAAAKKAKNEYMQADLYWHFDTTASWMSGLTRTARPFARGLNPLLELEVFADKIGRFRNPGKGKKAWLPLWRATQKCGASSKALVTLSAWPQILSALLHEISALHPKADTFLQGLGAGVLLIDRAKNPSQVPTIFAESWVRSPGESVALEWLSALFGKPKTLAKVHTWPGGSILPFAIRAKDGSTIGAGFTPDSRIRALKMNRHISSRDENLLVRFRAKPLELARAFPQKSAATVGTLAKLWQELNAQLTREPSHLHLRFRAQ